MPFTLDRSTPIGKVRTLIPDKRESEMMLDDDDIEVCLEEEGGIIKLAVAASLELIAADTALVEKYFKTSNFESDGNKTAATLLKRAADIRDRYDKARKLASEEENLNFFETVPGPCPDVDDFLLL